MEKIAGRKIKILIVGVSETCGGIETLFHALFEKKDDRYDIDFITFSKKCAFEDEYLKNGYRVFHLPSRASRLLKFNKTVADFFKEHCDYDYIWVNTSSTSMYQFQYYGKKYTKAKVITHSHGTKSENRSLATALINSILAVINRGKVLKNTDLFFCCSKAAGIALFGKKYKDRLIVINNGVNIEDFSFDETARHNLRTEFGFQDDETVVGVVGRISMQKNPKRVADIMELCVRDNAKIKVLFVGKGDLEQNVKDYISQKGLENSVVFAGFRSDVNKLYSAIDVLLMPSFFEGLPLTAVEAQVSGLPCLLSSAITEETAITDMVKFLDLKTDDGIWADEIKKMAQKKVDRLDYAKILAQSAFNIENVRKFVKEVIV